ncbi:MAG TPA: hypothetical protein VE732_07440 [Nitrososphaera sp.]|jgi:hypothetical protein|nr:hypothetical protein [Nitrososphaera sp.]
MRQTILGILAALLTFTFSVAGVWLLGLDLSDTPAIDPPQQDQSAPTRDFIDDYSVDFEPSCSCTDYPSAASSERALREKMKTAGLWCYNSELIKREPKLNAEGRRVDRRVVAIIGCGEEGQTFATIWWTEGAQFCEIRAPLLRQAETLEKNRRP